MSGTGLTSLEEDEGLTYITIIVDYSHFSFSSGGWREIAYRMYSHVSVQAPSRIKRPKRSAKPSVMVGKEESSKRTHTVSAGARHKQSSESINGRRKHLEKGRWAVEDEYYYKLNERGIRAVFILAPSSRHITIYTRRHVVFLSAYKSGHHPSHHKPLCRHSVLLPRPSSKGKLHVAWKHRCEPSRISSNRAKATEPPVGAIRVFIRDERPMGRGFGREFSAGGM